jgi:hypothetical protein
MDRLGVLAVLSLVLVGTGIALLVSDLPPVVVSWETASEVGTAGFNVYRTPAWSSATPGPAVRANVDLIPAEGDEMVGAAYSFVDDDASLRPWRRYRYQIEEVEWNGSATLYPEAVQVRAGLPRAWTKVEGSFLIVLGLALLWSRLRRDVSLGVDG